MKKNESAVVAAYLAVCIIWGSTYLAMRIAVSEFPPELFAGTRFLLAGAIVLIFAIANKKAFPESFMDIIKAAIPGIFMLMGANGLVMWAEQWVHSGVASLLLSTTPLFIAVIELMFFRSKKIDLVAWGLLILGFAGTAMLIITGKGVGSIDLKGGLIVLTASMLWAIGSIYSKRVKSSGHIITHIGIQMFSAGIGLTIVGICIGEVSKVHLTSNVVMSLLYLVVFGSIIGYSSNMYVLSKWPASLAITSAYINPIIAVILGVLLLKENMNLTMLFSMIITLGSVVLLHLRKYGLLQKLKPAKTQLSNES